MYFFKTDGKGDKEEEIQGENKEEQGESYISWCTVIIPDHDLYTF